MDENMSDNLKSLINMLEQLISDDICIALRIDDIYVTIYDYQTEILVFTNFSNTRELKEQYDFFSMGRDSYSKKCLSAIDTFSKYIVESNGDLYAKYVVKGGLNDTEYKMLQNWKNQKDPRLDSYDIGLVIEKSTKTNNGGCYVATAVYGSYDCPQVWRFRRYRDEALSKNIFGRLFIKIYYAVSPTVIKYFGKTKWFNSFFRKHLDKFYLKLAEKGYDDTPYQDI